MTEYEKKQNGMVYDPRDPELRAQQNRAKEFMRKYNNTAAADMEERVRILKELLGSLGRNVCVNQLFYVDYDNNISLGDNSFVNLNCTLLDTGKITIGKNTLIGPDVKIYTAVHSKNAAERFKMLDKGEAAINTSTAPVNIGDFVWIGGGAIKNISIGIASAQGKSHIHSGGTGGKMWSGEQNAFLESMVEAGKSVVDYLDGNILYSVSSTTLFKKPSPYPNPSKIKHSQKH